VARASTNKQTLRHKHGSVMQLCHCGAHAPGCSGLALDFRVALASRAKAELAVLWRCLHSNLSVLSRHAASGTLPLHLGATPVNCPEPEACVVLMAGAAVLGKADAIVDLWNEFPTHRLRLGVVCAMLAMEQGQWAAVAQVVDLLYPLGPKALVATSHVLLAAAVMDLRAVALPRILDMFADPMKVFDNLCRTPVGLAAAAGNVSALGLLRARGAGSGLLDKSKGYHDADVDLIRAGLHLQSPLSNAIANCQLASLRTLLALLDGGAADLNQLESDFAVRFAAWMAAGAVELCGSCSSGCVVRGKRVTGVCTGAATCFVFLTDTGCVGEQAPKSGRRVPDSLMRSVANVIICDSLGCDFEGFPATREEHRVATLRLLPATRNPFARHAMEDKTALQTAAGLGLQQVVRFLVEEAGVPVNDADEACPLSALFYATSSGHTAIAHYLLDHGAVIELPSAPYQRGCNIFCAAADAGDSCALLRRLTVAFAAAVFCADDRGENVLHHCVRAGRPAALRLLFECGAPGLGAAFRAVRVSSAALTQTLEPGSLYWECMALLRAFNGLHAAHGLQPQRTAGHGSVAAPVADFTQDPTSAAPTVSTALLAPSAALPQVQPAVEVVDCYHEAPGQAHGRGGRQLPASVRSSNIAPSPNAATSRIPQSVRAPGLVNYERLSAPPEAPVVAMRCGRVCVRLLSASVAPENSHSTATLHAA